MSWQQQRRRKQQQQEEAIAAGGSNSRSRRKQQQQQQQQEAAVIVLPEGILPLQEPYIIYSVFVPLAWNKYILKHIENYVKLVFLLNIILKILEMPFFSIKTKYIVNIVVMGLRNVKHIGIYNVD